MGCRGIGCRYQGERSGLGALGSGGRLGQAFLPITQRRGCGGDAKSSVSVFMADMVSLTGGLCKSRAGPEQSFSIHASEPGARRIDSARSGPANLPLELESQPPVAPFPFPHSYAIGWGFNK